MGLDVVEIVMQVEEKFAIDLPDQDCEQVRTVGDLYRLVLRKLDLPYQSASGVEASPPTPRGRYDPWTTPSVWRTIKGTIVDQLQVDEEEVREDASFQEDLGAD